MDPSGKKLTIINVYNAPPGSRDAGEGVKALVNLSFRGSRERLLVAGDFNLRHPSWQPSCTTTSPWAENLVGWSENQSLTLTTESDSPTHARGNVLDLTFVSSSLNSLGVETAIAREMDATSDHLPIVTVVPWDIRFREPLTHLKLETLDAKLFLALLESGIKEINDLPRRPSTEVLDNHARQISETIRRAYCGSARRALGKGTGHAWWNDEC
ncbi:hypothetical protein K3495_g16633, partial [Podosphaera aphanis]